MHAGFCGHQQFGAATPRFGDSFRFLEARRPSLPGLLAARRGLGSGNIWLGELRGRSPKGGFLRRPLRVQGGDAQGAPLPVPGQRGDTPNGRGGDGGGLGHIAAPRVLSSCRAAWRGGCCQLDVPDTALACITLRAAPAPRGAGYGHRARLAAPVASYSALLLLLRVLPSRLSGPETSPCSAGLAEARGTPPPVRLRAGGRGPLGSQPQISPPREAAGPRGCSPPGPTAVPDPQLPSQCLRPHAPTEGRDSWRGQGAWGGGLGTGDGVPHAHSPV